ncbi:hypothetical protein N9K18_00415 [Candidatus Pelagibacter sp.]|nr:hypothetical protein [Candidatus Pelagibacter sp.]|tara:strand:- start:125 stop:994 length:870 start_codon:yes stop_codon:yes gene_type:complete
MKALWLVSFRPIGKSKINDLFQSVFVDSIKSLDFDITFSLTQFDEPNVKEFVEKKEIKNIYKNISKSKLPNNKKYSNKLMLDNALEQFVDDSNDFQYLIYSTADIIVPNNLFESLSKIKLENYCAFIYPNTHSTNGSIKNSFWPHYGIDLIIFKISKEKAILFQKIIKSYNQYDWGINENFYIAASEALKLKTINIVKNSNVIKFDNDFQSFAEDRSWQSLSWKENQGYLLNFLVHNNLSKMYAYGSYYYLLFKVFNFKDLNFNLFLSYLIFYPYNFIRKIITKITKSN